MDINTITEKIIQAAIEVHKILGPGLLESAYKKALAYELEKLGLEFELEVPISIKYKEIDIKPAYRADMIVENRVVVELKAQEDKNDMFKAQILTNTKLSSKWFSVLSL